MCHGADVYERLSKGDAAVYVTQVISGVWHGLFPGYGLFFLSSAIFIQASKNIFKYERNWSAAAKGSWAWIAFKWAFTSIILNYCATAFLVWVKPCLPLPFILPPSIPTLLIARSCASA